MHHDPTEDEDQVIIACSGYMHTRQLVQDLFRGSISSVSLFLSQPNLNYVAKIPTWAKIMCLDQVKFAGSVSGPKQTSKSNHHQIDRAATTEPFDSIGSILMPSDRTLLVLVLGRTIQTFTGRAWFSAEQQCSLASS